MIVFTIGHSNVALERFVNLLHANEIAAVADVRSEPYARYTPHFSRDALKLGLRAQGVGYAFLGETLGGRPVDELYYDEDGHVRYELVAEAPYFNEGLQRLLHGASQGRVAMMCSEGQPHECHRHLLIARVLIGQGVTVSHITPDGEQVDAAELFEESPDDSQETLFGKDPVPWRSVRSVSRKTPLRHSSDD